MQFRVPQFIDMEDKVVGPLTLKQFAYILGAGGFSFIIWTFISIKLIAIPLILAVSGLFLSLAFIRFNNRPFADIMESAFAYYTGSKLYTWKQPKPEDTKSVPIDDVVAKAAKEVTIAKANKDKIHELSLGLDVFEHTPESVQVSEQKPSGI